MSKPLPVPMVLDDYEKNDRACSFAGCPKPIVAKGLCHGHYKQRSLGKPLKELGGTALTPDQRFLKSFTVTPSCWVWVSQMNKSGYGTFFANRKSNLAHRYSYELFVGPIADGMAIDHLCHVRACVNPDHLRPVTHKQNMENRAGADAGSKSGVRGVGWHPGTNKWQATVCHNGVNYYLGLYATITEAEAAVRAKRLELFTHNEVDRRLS